MHQEASFAGNPVRTLYAHHLAPVVDECLDGIAQRGAKVQCPSSTA